MVFARMRGTGGGRGRPVRQPMTAFLRRRVHERIVQPSIECRGRRLACAAHDPARIVEAEPLPTISTPLFTQRRDQFSDPDMFGWIEARLNRELHQRQRGPLDKRVCMRLKVP